MVLFKEDEARMKKEEREAKRARQTPLGRWVRRIIKVSMVIGVLFCFGLMLLANLSGSHEAVRKGVEDYLSDVSGFQVSILKLNNITFYPDVGIDAEDIVFKTYGEDSETVAKVGSAKFVTGFFDIMFSRQRFKSMTINDIHIDKAVLTGDSIDIASLSVEDAEKDDEAIVILKGHYGEKPLSSSLIFEKLDNGKNYYYKMPKESTLKLSLGNIDIEAQLDRSKMSGTGLKITKFAVPEQALTADLFSVRKMFGRELEGSLVFGESKADVNVEMKKGHVTGEIVFENLVYEDLQILRKTYDALSILGRKSEKADITFGKLKADIKVRVPEMHGPHGSFGSLSMDIDIADDVLRTTLDGDVNKGKLESDITLDAAKSPAELTVESTLKKWNYGHYQSIMFDKEDLSGTANVKMSVSSKGDSYEALLSGLEGELVFIADKGKFASKTLNIWGVGLVRAMLPSLNPDELLTMNCMIADFKIKDGVAKPEPLFMDTVRLTVVGEGEINLPEDKIDMQLEPKSKDPAFLDVATAVNVRGPISRPEISSDTFSLFEKIGGLALGFINPAFLVFSLTDLGLTESHPCYQYLEKSSPSNDSEAAQTQDKPDQNAPRTVNE